jgi:hypothetical protein
MTRLILTAAICAYLGICWGRTIEAATSSPPAEWCIAKYRFLEKQQGEKP